MLFPRISAFLALAWLTLLVSGCGGLSPGSKDLKAPTVSLTSLSVKEMSLLNPSFLVKLRVHNPNAVDFGLDGAEAVLTLNGRQVAIGRNVQAVTLTANGATVMAVEVKASNLGLIQEVLRLGSGQPLDYRVTGQLRPVVWLAPLGEMTFDFRGTLTRDSLLKGLSLLR